MDEKQTQRYLQDLYAEVVRVFDVLHNTELAAQRTPIKFSEYMKRYAKNVKMYKPDKNQLGGKVEDFVRQSLSSADGIRITKTTPELDNCYGADFKIQHTHDGKPASLYVDVKLGVRFDPDISYLHHTGQLVDGSENASKFNFSFGTVRFGIKKWHKSFFQYTKPVVVMYISCFSSRLKQDEINMLSFILCNINHMLINNGYPNRASQFIIPNYKFRNI